MHRSLEMTTEPSGIGGKGKLLNRLLCLNWFVIQSISLVYMVMLFFFVEFFFHE